MNIRFRKVLRDLTLELAKNSLLALAIAIGVFGIGCILGGYAVVKREMRTNYQQTLPASATIELNDSISSDLVNRVKRLPIVQTADRRITVQARMQVHGRWFPMLLFVLDRFDSLSISRFRRVAGVVQPRVGTMVVERTALSMMAAQMGEAITVKTRNGTPGSVTIAGVVHDPALAPAWQEQAGYGYITLETLHWLGEQQGFNQLKIRMVSDTNSVKQLTESAETVAHWLTQQGYRVHEIQVPPPNKHPHQSQMETVMRIFIVFSVLILLLGAMLVATALATLMVKQVRQIGILKAIGATTGQIAGMYGAMLLILSLAALAVGVPLSQIGASALYRSMGNLLNLDITNPQIPYWVVAVQVGTGVLIPLLIAAIPIFRGSQVAIRVALDNTGVSASSKGSLPWLARKLTARAWGNTFQLAVRNVFRQRARLITTLGLLAAGGAMFMTALNIADAWDVNLSRMYTQRLYDLEIRLQNASQVQAAQSLLQCMPGVGRFEIGYFTPATLGDQGPFTVTHTYPDKGHGSFSVLALPIASTLIRPTLKAGRWLLHPQASEVVLNQLARTTAMQLGDSITLMLGEKPTRWQIVGFTEDVGSAATAYISADVLPRQLPPFGYSTQLRVAFQQRDKSYAGAKIQEIETAFEQAGITIRSSVPVWLLRNAIAGHMRILVNSLLAMALLMALVGSLGLLSTMSMNVLERTREIGVMRAIGATPARIRKLIVSEGLVMGGLSLLLAFGLSLLLSTYLGRLIGYMAFRTPLTLTVSYLALGSWIGIILVGSLLATLVPARRANRLTTREALAYE